MSDAVSLHAMARGEREVAEAWLDEGKPNLHRAHPAEALRLDVLARQEDGELSLLLCGTALLMAGDATGDVDSLLAAARLVLS